MYFSDKLIFKGIENKEEVLSCIAEGDEAFNVFLLCKGKGRNLLELFELSELRTEYCSKKNYKVLGIAGGKQNGMLMAKELIEGYIKKHGSLKGFKARL